ncbi:hypothetical protein [Spiroplasma tabanidicola]|nr:hypothetical protein [Spiroplasma tabanidicola]
MKKISMNDISSYVSYGINEQKFFIKKDFKPANIYLEKLRKNCTGGYINIMNTYDILIENFPYINNLSKDTINNSINQQECVKDMIYKSVYHKKEQNLRFIKNECNNKVHINMVKRFITEINAFIYKHKIHEVFANKIFMHISYKTPFIGRVDLLLKSKDEYFQIEIKTSKVNFIEKNNASLFLNKALIEDSKEIKIKESFILNIRENKVIQEYQKPKKSLEKIIFAKNF